MKPFRYTQEMIDRYTKAGYWGIEEDWEAQNARDYPDKEALVDSKSRLTFSQVKRKSDRLAIGFLEMGLKKAQIMVVQLPNIVEHIIVKSAMRKAGLISMSTMMYFRHKEIEFALGRTRAMGVVIMAEFHGFNYFRMIREIHPDLPDLNHVFVVGDQVPEGAISINEMMERPLEEKYPLDYLEKTKIQPGEVSELGMTSGTTGFPKLTEKAADPINLIGKFTTERFKVTGDDIFAALAPLPGGAAAPCRTVAPRKACKVVLLERFDAEEALKLIEREKITVACGVPAQMAMMVKHPNLEKYDLSSLRTFFYAGAKLPYSVAEEVEEKMGCRIVNRLGGVDTGSPCSTSIDDPPEVRRTSVGKPYPGVQVRLVDEQGQEVPQGEVGEILWRGPTAMPGYYQDPGATLEKWGGERDGWCHMGDLGRFDDQGNLYVVGRRKDMIIRGGQNIYPAEIESMLITHPKVLDVTIVAMPDPVMGEKACAYVIPKPGQALTFDEMVSFLMEKKIAKYKLPERLELVDSFPMSGDGQKVLKRELTERVTRKLKAEGTIL